MSEEKEVQRDKTISYTQFAMWKECPFRWKLNYIDRNRKKIETISTLFGRSMHEVLQYYLTVMYTRTIPEADSLDLPKLLFDKMSENFLQARSQGAEMTVSKNELVEFYEDGCEILEWFVRNKADYFSKRGFQLVGVEVPIEVKIQNGITMSGYLDIVIRDVNQNRIHIIDFKTSHQGWNMYQKADKQKLSQLVLYKIFYAQQYGYKPQDVDVEFMILKRKLFEKVDFPQKRVQRVTPASGTITANNVLLELRTFINSCFDENGNYRTDVEYEKRPSEKSCRYCEFKDDPRMCDKNNPKRAQRLIQEQKSQEEPS